MSNVRSPQQRDKGFAALGLALLCGAFCLSACGPTAEDRYQQRLATTTKPALHAVTAYRLRDIMNKLEFNPMPDRVYSEAVTIPREQMRDAASAAARMAEAAKDIPQVADELGLDGQHKETFLTLATKLGSQSAELSRLLNAGEYNTARTQVERMRGTCHACHALFHPRGYVLPPERSPAIR